MFNAYHSAYLGARGFMSLLGIGLPHLPNGGQLLVDVFPQPEFPKRARKAKLGDRKFEEFLIVRMPPFDQRTLWEAFQRVLRISEAACCDVGIRAELLDVQYEDITRPRNRFLYNAAFWPGQDLIIDSSPSDLARLIGAGLDSDHEGFLLRLGFLVYRLFEQLIGDLAAESGVIRDQLSHSRIVKHPLAVELATYNTFLSQVTPPPT
jgi:hypothetical protein